MTRIVFLAVFLFSTICAGETIDSLMRDGELRDSLDKLADESGVTSILNKFAPVETQGQTNLCRYRIERVLFYVMHEFKTDKFRGDATLFCNTEDGQKVYLNKGDRPAPFELGNGSLVFTAETGCRVAVTMDPANFYEPVTVEKPSGEGCPQP